MEVFGKVIRIHLKDGAVTGIRIGEVVNQTIQAWSFPRIPTIVAINQGGQNEVITKNGFRESYQSDYWNNYSNRINSILLGELAEKTIYKYASINKMTHEIGGSIQIVQIRSNGSIVWLKNKPVLFIWQTIQNFLKDYFAKKIKINFINEEGEIFFNQQAKNLLNTK